MRWASREQVQAARTALATLSQYRPPTGGEDATFTRLNRAAARTQEPLHWAQRIWLYQVVAAPEPTTGRRVMSAVLIAGLLAVLVLEIVTVVTGP